MSYTAYNALLSISESRKKKAHDMWASIKQKTLDCAELQELTMIKCLETDAKVVEKLGITVNIHDYSHYDLVDLSLRELKSLLPILSNVMVPMKKTLETIGNNSIK